MNGYALDATGAYYIALIGNYLPLRCTRLSSPICTTRFAR